MSAQSLPPTRDQIKTSVVHSSPEVRKMFKDILGNKKILRVSRGEYKVAADYIKDVNDVNYVDRGQHLIFAEPAAAVGISEEIKERGRHANIILLEKDPNVFSESAVEIANARYALDQVRTPDGAIRLKKLQGLTQRDALNYAGKVDSLIQSLRDSEKMWRQLRIAFIGGGQSTTGIMGRIVAQPWVERIFVHSDYYESRSEEQGHFMKLFEHVRGSGKIRAASIEEIVGAQPDIVAITTGIHRLEIGERSVVNREDLVPGWKKISKYAPQIAQMPNEPLVFTSTNPVESYLVMLHQRYGISGNRLFSIASDGKREQTFAHSILCSKAAAVEEWERHISTSTQTGQWSDYIDKESLPTNQAGRHGFTIPLWSRELYSRGHKFKNQVNPLAIVPKNIVHKLTKEAGRQIRETAMKTGINYNDFPEAVAEGFQEIAHLQRHPEFSWGTYVPAHLVQELMDERASQYQSPFLFLPVEIDYSPLRINVRQGFSFNTRDITTDMKTELARQIEEIYEEVNRISKECGYRK